MFADLKNLAVDTVRVCWRLFPQLLTIYLLGWLASSLAQRLSVAAAELSAWAGLAVFTFSFLFTLVAVVLILRLLGRELGVWDIMPAEESVRDDRDASLTQMLAVTLLPFLSVLAAFGQVSEAASALSVEQTFKDPLGGTTSVLGVVQGTARDHPWRLFLILAGLYVVRRVLDVVHERTRIRSLGLLVALVESFFILVVLFGGFVIARRVSSWISNRAFAGWWDELKEQVVRMLAALDVTLPALVERAWTFWSSEVWPSLWPVLSQPIIWLAVAALIYGSQVLSLAELWRKGQPLAARVPGASRFSRYADKRALQRQFRPPPRGVRWLLEEFRGAFFSDIDDKYLPTFHSLRLVLRAGAVFLGSYIALYTAILVIQNSVTRLVHGLTGGREVGFWYVADPFLTLAGAVPWELLRLCLLAVTFRRCLVIFRDAGANQAPAQPPALRATHSLRPRGRHRRVVGVTTRRLRSVLLALALIAASAVLFRLSSEPQNFEVVRASVGELVAYQDGSASVGDVRVGTTLRDGPDSIGTAGVFVMVRVEVQAPRQTSVTVQQLELLTPDRSYAPYTDFGVITAAPGFEASRDVVFEVDPADLAGMTVEAADNSFVVGYHQRLRAHLGVTKVNAGEWLAAAEDQRLNLEMATQTRGLS